VIVVTSDKCYENAETARFFAEGDRLGGKEAYGASKACAEIAAAAYSASYGAGSGRGLRVATARAGNVIGGGDWSLDRLVPDAVRAFAADEKLIVRAPDAERPWQHVAEPVFGYLLLARALLEQGEDFAAAWNFGPPTSEHAPVREIARRLAAGWGGAARWEARPEPGAPPEARLLRLDSAKARRYLGWSPRGSVDLAVERSVGWYKDFYAGAPIEGLRARMRQDREILLETAAEAGVHGEWSIPRLGDPA
jgi:CDP-glucose 4,6-dehydratase